MAIRTAAVLLAFVYFLIVVSGGDNRGGHLCHLGGMATGLFWTLGRSHMEAFTARIQTKFSRRSDQDQAKLELEVDRILAKVHDHGIHSLTRGEKQLLQKATQERKKHGL